MLRTIQVGNYQFIQGEYLKDIGDGKIAVRVYGTVHVGRPVTSYLREISGRGAANPNWNDAKLAS